MAALHRILLVDDEKHINELAISALRRLSESSNDTIAKRAKQFDLFLPNVCTFQLEGEAYIISLIQAEGYDLVLLDVNLCSLLGTGHKYSGLRILHKLRKAGYKGRILLYSGHNLRNNQLAIVLADDVFVKGTQFSDLLNKIVTLLAEDSRFEKMTSEDLAKVAGEVGEIVG